MGTIAQRLISVEELLSEVDSHFPTQEVAVQKFLLPHKEVREPKKLYTFAVTTEDFKAINSFTSSLKDILPRLLYGEPVGAVGVGLRVPALYSKKNTQLVRQMIFDRIVLTFEILRQYGVLFNLNQLFVLQDATEPTGIRVEIVEVGE
ncbi:MAG: hypothetical protein QXY76_03315 [Nitrososphaeria archaeon]